MRYALIKRALPLCGPLKGVNCWAILWCTGNMRAPAFEYVLTLEEAVDFHDAIMDHKFQPRKAVQV